MSNLQKARQSLSWMESELHGRGLKDETRHQWAADVRKVLNDQPRLLDALLFCVEQLENEDPDKDCMDNIAADQARALILEVAV